MPYRPTTRLAAVVAVAALATVIAGFWGLGPQLAGAAWLLLLPVLVDLVLLIRHPGASPRVPQSIEACLRRTYELSVDLHGGGAIASVALMVPPELGGPFGPRDFVPPASVGCITFNAVPRRRGTHGLGPVWITQKSPLGMWLRRYHGDVSCRVLVRPDVRGPADDVIGLELMQEGEAATVGLPRTGSELRGLRPFQSGDDPRHVDWKATARVGAPVVREWLPDRRRVVLVALDAGRLMRAEHDGETKLDASLRALARTALAAESRGDWVGALVYTDGVSRYVPPLSGAGQAERLLRYVGDIEPRPVESDLAQALPQLLGIGRRALVVVISDVTDSEGSERLCAAVAQIATRHLLAVALVRDPHLDDALRCRVGDAFGAYRRAAAEMVASERQGALELLRARGILALDLSMRSLALEVVQGYLGMRLTGRW